jgi:MFS family permease
MLATPWVFIVVPGNFIIAALLTQYFGIDKAVYGAIVSLPAWSNAVQIIALPWLSRFLTPKDLTLGLGWFNIGIWSMFAAVLGFLPVGDAKAVAPLFIVFFVLSSLSHAFIGVGWTTWVRDWVPLGVRGIYFGRRNRWLSLVTVGYLVLAITVFEIWEFALWPYQVLIITAVVLRYGSIIWQYAIHTKSDHTHVIQNDWFGQIRECLRSPGLLTYILFSAWINFWLGFVGPFVPVFSFEELGLDPGTFTILVIIATLTGMVGWAFWGRQIDRFGSIPVLCLGLFFWEIQSYLWVILNPGNVWLLYPMWMWGGFFSTAYFLGSFNLLLNLLPEKSKLAGISLNLAVTSVTAGVSPILAGMLLYYFIERLGGGIEVYRVGFAIKATAVLLGLVFLRGMREPKRSGRTEIPGAFRTLRQLLAIQNLGFLANLIPLRNKRPRKK